MFIVISEPLQGISLQPPKETLPPMDSGPSAFVDGYAIRGTLRQKLRKMLFDAARLPFGTMLPIPSSQESVSPGVLIRQQQQRLSYLSRPLNLKAVLRFHIKEHFWLCRAFAVANGDVVVQLIRKRRFFLPESQLPAQLFGSSSTSGAALQLVLTVFTCFMYEVSKRCIQAGDEGSRRRCLPRFTNGRRSLTRQNS